MANTRLSMVEIEEVLRLHCAGGRSNREIAQAVRVSPTTVADYLRRAPAGRSDVAAGGRHDQTDSGNGAVSTNAGVPGQTTGARLGGGASSVGSIRASPWMQLWQEYRERHPEGYQYSAFCLHYRAFAQTLPVTLRQSHAPGERLFVNYSGQTVAVVDPTTGEERPAQIFVAVLGASNYTFVENDLDPGLADWLGSHVRCLEFLGGVPELLVPDNLKARSRPPTATNPTSTPATPTWRPTTGWRSSRPGWPSRATRRRHHTVSCGVDGKVIRCGSRGVLHPWPLTTVSPVARGANRQRWPFP